MKRTICAIAIFAVLALLVWSIVQKTDLLSSGQPSHDLLGEEIQGPVTIGQSFTASYPNLERIDIKLTTLGRKNTGHLIFHLRRNLADENDIFSKTIPLTDLLDHTYYSFSFPPIRDSDNKTFYFTLQSLDSSPGNAITALPFSKGALPGAEWFLSGKPMPGDLAFFAYYQVSSWDRIGATLGRLTADKPLFLGNRVFYVLLLAIYVFLVVALLANVWREKASL